MGSVPFTKAHADGNDFLIVERRDLEAAGIGEAALPDFAKRICRRHFGVGADGLEVVGESADADAELRLWNADGGAAEISGNGTRCAAAYLTAAQRVGGRLSLATGAGVKRLELLRNSHPEYAFKMDMGAPVCEDAAAALDMEGSRWTAVLVNAGNPQCVLFVEDFEMDWRKLGAAIERHPRFPKGTNVSFTRVVDRHTLEVRFWERGAGETMSSGTGAAGAAAAAILTGRAESPLAVKTAAGAMRVEWGDRIYLTGPAAIIASGRCETGA